MLKNKLTNWTSLIVLSFSALSTFTLLNNNPEGNKNLSSPVNKYPNIIPYDFFGDWSNGEYEWEDELFTYQVDPYIGKGMFSFMQYTSSYNKALKNGYDKAEYEDSYYDYVINGTQKFPYGGDTHNNIDGFIGIDQNWILSNVLKYMEDWIVWNFNEIQNYDVTLGKELTTSDFNFGIDLVLENKDEWLELDNDPKGWIDKKIFEMDEFCAFALFPSGTSEINYYWISETQPKSKKPTYNSISNSFDYEINNIERLIMPLNGEVKHKENINNKITKEEAHNFLKNYDYKSTSLVTKVLEIGPHIWDAAMMNLAGLEATADKLIFEALNKDNEFVNKYGLDYLKANQRVLAQEKEGYLTNFISTKDYQVNYEVSDDGLNWETKNTIGNHWVGHSYFPDPYPIRLDSINYLRVSITMYDSPRTESGFISEVFKPREEWGIVDPSPDPQPDPNPSINYSILVLAILFFIFITVIAISLFLVLIKYRKKK